MTGEKSMFSSYLHLEGPKETIAYGGDTCNIPQICGGVLNNKIVVLTFSVNYLGD
jgi:hypothetical protein